MKSVHDDHYIAASKVAGARTKANGPSFRWMPVNPGVVKGWQKAQQVCKLDCW